MILTPDNEYFAVLDACVLAPMLLCELFLRCAEEPALFRLLWSDEILTELERSLQEAGYSQTQAEFRLRKMREAFPEACISVPPALLNCCPGICSEKDKHVLAAAIREGAHVIVTWNVQSFPADALEPYGILVHTPDEFLLHQYHLNPERLCEILDLLAHSKKLTRAQLLSGVSSALPIFCNVCG